jgi:tRNA(Arg) A34 adenosine deaminase TadA
MDNAFPLPGPMRRALDLAAIAADAGEVPVGAVVTLDGEIIAEAGNAMRGQFDPTAHAELVAIRAAAVHLGRARLDGCELWVSLEPCAMCAAAVSLARISKLTFAAEDPKGGAVIHGARVFSQPTCHHKPEVLHGIGEKEAAEQLRAFFEARR